MSGTPKPKLARRLAGSGEDYLAHVGAFTLTLEGGVDVEVDVGREARISDDLNEVRTQARRAPARLAFWAHQTARALARVRAQETLLRKLEGERNIQYRVAIDTNSALQLTEALVAANVDRDDQVVAARSALNALRQRYDLLRCVRDAVEQRCFILRGLLRAENDARYEPSAQG